MEVDRETSRNQNTGAHDHQKGIRGEEWRVQLTEYAKGQLTESVGVVDVDHDFSWCLDFNRRRWRGDGSWPKLMPGRCPYIRVLPSTLTLCDSYFASHDS